MIDCLSCNRRRPIEKNSEISALISTSLGICHIRSNRAHQILQTEQAMNGSHLTDILECCRFTLHLYLNRHPLLP